MKVKKLEAKNVLLDMKATSTWLFISQNFPRAIDQNIDSLLLGINAKDWIEKHEGKKYLVIIY